MRNRLYSALILLFVSFLFAVSAQEITGNLDVWFGFASGISFILGVIRLCAYLFA